MGMPIEKLITFCEEEEYNHRLTCKRYDDASGYTRSKNKDIRTASAVREELLGDYYQQIATTMHKYQKIQEIVKDHDDDRMPEDYWYIDRIREVIKDDDGTN